LTRNWEEIDRFLSAHGVEIGQPMTAQTVGGKHVSTSNHYTGTARDYGVSTSDAEMVASKLHYIAVAPDTPIAELFCSVGATQVFIKNGRRLSPVPPTLLSSHRDHCHVALKPGRRLF
jgi:hypothetical protein